jgi:hypothetical protein
MYRELQNLLGSMEFSLNSGVDMKITIQDFSKKLNCEFNINKKEYIKKTNKAIKNKFSNLDSWEYDNSNDVLTIKLRKEIDNTENELLTDIERELIK